MLPNDSGLLLTLPNDSGLRFIMFSYVFGGCLQSFDLRPPAGYFGSVLNTY